MGALISALAAFFTPVLIFCASLSVIVIFLISALADPSGQWNLIVCSAIDLIATIFPSTPDNLKVSSLLGDISGAPSIFQYVASEVLSTVFILISSAVVIKIYKLIPFKST